MQLIDPGLPDWKGNVLKHLSTAQLNLARMDMEENRYYQPCFRDFTYQNVTHYVNYYVMHMLFEFLIFQDTSQ